ncbi:uncharacterized protein LOC111087618, partial [Limulus polyphemus]|uniref:Uncharacterized protein LOC111087618 n=1 Tax=Limulus polyphemus TaxID=6850 RepID=A0ABM1T3Z0_LIMPO
PTNEEARIAFREQDEHLRGLREVLQGASSDESDHSDLSEVGELSTCSDESGPYATLNNHRSICAYETGTRNLRDTTKSFAFNSGCHRRHSTENPAYGLSRLWPAGHNDSVPACNSSNLASSESEPSIFALPPGSPFDLKCVNTKVLNVTKATDKCYKYNNENVKKVSENVRECDSQNGRTEAEKDHKSCELNQTTSNLSTVTNMQEKALRESRTKEWVQNGARPMKCHDEQLESQFSSIVTVKKFNTYHRSNETTYSQEYSKALDRPVYNSSSRTLSVKPRLYKKHATMRKNRIIRNQEKLRTAESHKEETTLHDLGRGLRTAESHKEETTLHDLGRGLRTAESHKDETTLHDLGRRLRTVESHKEETTLHDLGRGLRTAESHKEETTLHDLGRGLRTAESHKEETTLHDLGRGHVEDKSDLYDKDTVSSSLTSVANQEGFFENTEVSVEKEDNNVNDDVNTPLKEDQATDSESRNLVEFKDQRITGSNFTETTNSSLERRNEATDSLSLNTLLEEATKDNSVAVPMVVMQYTRLHLHLGKDPPFQQSSLQMGTLVTAFYKESDWFFVQTPHGVEGFIHSADCMPLGALLTRESVKSHPWDVVTVKDKIRGSHLEVMFTEEKANLRCDRNETLSSKECTSLKNGQQALEIEPSTDKRDMKLAVSTTKMLNHPRRMSHKPGSQVNGMEKIGEHSAERVMFKDAFWNTENNGAKSEKELCVIQEYTSRGRNIMTVKKGDVLTLINNDLKDWLWVRSATGGEGFVPRACTSEIVKL